MERFYIITNLMKDPDYGITKEIQKYIEQHGRECILAKEDEQGFIFPGTVPENVDCGIVLGGDGTLIRAARELAEYEFPLIGINLGTLGFLAEVERSDFSYALERLFKNQVGFEERMMLSGEVSGNSSYQNVAVNDIVITRDGSLRIVHFDVYVNGTLLNSYMADGVIISTPTGTTGYNLSAGGPVVEPTASMFVITPICSHALNTSSIVLSAEDTIEIVISQGRYGKDEQALVTFDGADMLRLGTGDRVTIKRSDHVTSHAKIIELIAQHDIETQEELAEYLNREGFKVTQATVSRDIRDLRLTKVAVDGSRQKYVVLAPEKDEMNEKYIRVLRDGYISMDMAQNILVIKTVSGMAMAVAAAVDAMKWKEVVGCIAGDDTIMCAIRSVQDTEHVMDKIRKIVSKGI